ncbi:MAG: hypothetical protein WAO02_13600 [Verrucomicrobiia bacterium]
MQRFLLQCLNVAWLVLVFIGLPAATRAQWGGWQISSSASAELLMLWGLALAVAGNLIAALGLIKSLKERKLCWEWTAVFCGLLLVQYAFHRGCFNFDWLKQALVWLQRHH